MISLGVGAIIAAIISAVGAASAAGINYASQKSTNDANASAQAAANKQNQYNLEHAHQIEMNDLAQAGLNPVLTATCGQGAPMVSMNAPRAVAPQVDLSGVSTAINSMTHMLMMSELIDAKTSAAEANATAKIEAAQIGASSRERVANIGRNSSAGESLINSADSVARIASKMGLTKKQLYNIARYNWIKR